MTNIRIKRLALELRTRRRRLHAYRGSPPWGGKDTAWRFELVRYDRYLVLAAETLEVPVPGSTRAAPLDPAVRAALEDRLAMAGLDLLARGPQSSGDVMEDGDLAI